MITTSNELLINYWCIANILISQTKVIKLLSLKKEQVKMIEFHGERKIYNYCLHQERYCLNFIWDLYIIK